MDEHTQGSGRMTSSMDKGGAHGLMGRCGKDLGSEGTNMEKLYALFLQARNVQNFGSEGKR